MQIYLTYSSSSILCFLRHLISQLLWFKKKKVKTENVETNKINGFNLSEKVTHLLEFVAFSWCSDELGGPKSN